MPSTQDTAEKVTKKAKTRRKRGTGRKTRKVRKKARGRPRRTKDKVVAGTLDMDLTEYEVRIIGELSKGTETRAAFFRRILREKLKAQQVYQRANGGKTQDLVEFSEYRVPLDVMRDLAQAKPNRWTMDFTVRRLMLWGLDRLINAGPPGAFLLKYGADVDAIGENKARDVIL